MGSNEAFVENVTIQGVTVDFFTFNSENTVLPVTVALESGDVTFKDCIFSNNVGDPLFSIAQFFFTSRRILSEEDATSIVERELKSDVKITFDSCTFDVRKFTHKSLLHIAFSSFCYLDLYRTIKDQKIHKHQEVYLCYRFLGLIFHQNPPHLVL
jgi:hypothetical protein